MGLFWVRLYYRLYQRIEFVLIPIYLGLHRQRGIIFRAFLFAWVHREKRLRLKGVYLGVDLKRFLVLILWGQKLRGGEASLYFLGECVHFVTCETLVGTVEFSSYGVSSSLCTYGLALESCASRDYCGGPLRYAKGKVFQCGLHYITLGRRRKVRVEC